MNLKLNIFKLGIYITVDSNFPINRIHLTLFCGNLPNKDGDVDPHTGTQ